MGGRGTILPLSLPARGLFFSGFPYEVFHIFPICGFPVVFMDEEVSLYGIGGTPWSPVVSHVVRGLFGDYVSGSILGYVS
jgi:hypothetical protein